jgi:FMN phosphatase YigB (HAD superfamily)
MWFFVIDLDDTAGRTTEDLEGDPARIKFLTLVPGVVEFLTVHKKRCALVTAGIEKDQRAKIGVLGIGEYFEETYVVPEPKDKLPVLERIVKSSKFGSPFNYVIVGDRPDIEIRKARELGALAVRVRIKGGRHSNKWPESPLDEAHFEVRDFFELLKLFPV